MAPFDAMLVAIVFYYAVVPEHKLFLFIQDLLGNAVPRPRDTVAFEVHLCLREHMVVSLQGSLRL